MPTAGEDVFKDFKEHSVAEFFKKNRQMLGYTGAIKSLTTAVHEFVTNALDACEAAKIAPDIFIQLERVGPDALKLVVEDNGPGIPKKFLGGVFGQMLAGTKFNVFKQSRGQQGIGATGVVMFSQVTTGKPTKIVTSTGDNKIYDAEVSIDFKNNKAILSNEKEYSGTMRGTRIETVLKGVKYQKGDKSPDEYLRRTALANPHTKITYIDPDNITHVWDRSVDAMPKMPEKTLPHPKGVEVDDMMSFASHSASRTISSFLKTDFVRISSQKVKEIEAKINFDINKRPQDMKWEEAEQLVKAFKEIAFIAPPTDCLIPINEQHLEKALVNIIKPEFYTLLTRSPAIYRGGVPFIVEVGLAFGGKAGRSVTEDVEVKKNEEGEEMVQSEMEIMRFANRVPLLFDAGSCAITKAILDIDWKRYSIKEGPVTVLVNFTSVHVPYTGTGKESIAEEDEVIKEIKLALQDTGRRLGSYVAGRKRKYEREMKRRLLDVYSLPVSEAIGGIIGKKHELVLSKIRELIESKYEGVEEEGGEEESELAEDDEGSEE